MSKISTIYACSNCGAQSPKWSGRCLECGSWGTLKQEVVDNKEVLKRENKKIAPAELIDFEKIETANFLKRIKTGISEIDRVLGGGIVSGSLILLSGEPGIGKSTVLAQIADGIGCATGETQEAKVIYVSGEESAAQVKNRLERLNCKSKNIKFLSETNVEKILSSLSAVNPELVIIDSIQTVYSLQAENEAGSIPQIRTCAIKFLEIAKEKNITFMLVGHITKDGTVAGPKTLEHIVDTVLYLESETAHDYRLLRAAKNRFGSVNELGIFEMTGAGFKEIKNPSSVFIDSSKEKITGSVLSCVMEGTRPFLVEIQALATKTVFGYPQRKSSGFDLNRLQVLAAVLMKRGEINLSNQDIILNIAGGLKVNDPALDLAVCLAISSSMSNKYIDRKTIVLGEVGLGGEVRNVSKLKE
ncbi:MAG: DNA repair protein RadA, partial [bacterium]